MSQADHAVSLDVPAHPSRLAWVMKTAVGCTLTALAIAFVGKYVLRYFVHYTEADFANYGPPHHWRMRGWLLLHMTGGTLALLLGPIQFWTGLRQRHMQLHRWTGRLFLVGVALGSVGAFRMTLSTTFGWAWAGALYCLATAWLTAAGMALYSILKRNVQCHKEWMIRAYVITFAFVTFRLLNDYGPTSHLQPFGDRIITTAWACWTIPLFATEVIMQLRRIAAS